LLGVGWIKRAELLPLFGLGVFDEADRILWVECEGAVILLRRAALPAGASIWAMTSF